MSEALSQSPSSHSQYKTRREALGIFIAGIVGGSVAVAGRLDARHTASLLQTVSERPIYSDQQFVNKQIELFGLAGRMMADAAMVTIGAFAMPIYAVIRMRQMRMKDTD